jgi:hypothetical protein
MRGLANALQSITTQVSDGPLGGYAEEVTAAEFSAAATRTAFWGMRVGARDRVLASPFSKVA